VTKVHAGGWLISVADGTSTHILYHTQLIPVLHLEEIYRNTNSTNSTYVVTRDGPKFGRRRSSAEGFGRMFGSVRLGNMWLFGRSSAELRPTFGVIVASN